jgi:hypothetical protein
MAKLHTIGDVPLRMLLYGMPGSTKTRTALSGAIDPRMQPMLVMNAGGNPESCEEFIKGNENNIAIVDVEKLEDYNDPFAWLMGGQPAGKFAQGFGLTEFRPFKSLVIDTLTQTQRMMFDKAQAVQPLPGQIVAKREWKDYQAVLYSIVNFTHLYFSLPMHVIMTAQEREGNEDRGRPIGPMLEGDGQVEAPSYALIVARMMHVTMAEAKERKVMQTEQADNVAIFRPTADFTAKDQHSNQRLGPFMYNPNMTKILDAIYGTAKEG